MTGEQALYIPPREAVNAAANRVRGLWLGYIALLAYLFITVGAVTHRDLLLESPVKLPVLNVDLPLVGFFAVAPVFFLINHFYLLLNLLGLSRRIKEFNAAVQVSGLFEQPETTERRRLDTFVIVQMLGGTAEERGGETGRFLKLISLITLVIAPVLLLLFIQLKFLPYQDQLVTWLNRIILLADLWLLWIFWPAIIKGEWDRSARPFVTRAAALLIGLFSCFLATFPGEIADGGLSARDWKYHRDSELWWAKGLIFGTIGNRVPERPYRHRPGLLFFARALDLTDNQTLIDHDTFDKIRDRFNPDQVDQNPWAEAQAPWESQRTRSFRRRNLRGVMFDRSDLRNVDFEDASLQGASLDRARLQGASLDRARLQGASLDRTRLQGASLDHAILQGVSLNRANLQGASLDEASLQGASLNHSNLQGAWLIKASLQGASLDRARLQGASLDDVRLKDASLDGASLQGASLDFAELQGASLNSASLQGASLHHASLQGASLHHASLQGASLDGASLQGASLDGASLQGASLDAASLQGASLDFASLGGASLHHASLLGASLDGASLQGASLHGARLLGASLDGARLQGVSLTSTFFWRAYGRPENVAASEINVEEPRLNAPSTETIDKLEENALKDIEDKEVIDRIRRRLGRLSATEIELEGGIQDRFWKDLEVKKDTLVYLRTLKEVLWVIACIRSVDWEAPHAAQGLIEEKPFRDARLEAVGPLHLRDLARDLLDAARGQKDDCLGVRGLDDVFLARLQQWAKEEEAGSAD